MYHICTHDSTTPFITHKSSNMNNLSHVKHIKRKIHHVYHLHTLDNM